MKYAAYGVVTGTKFLGTVDADSEEEALEKANDLDSVFISICHQCAREIDEPEIHEIKVEETT